MITIDWRSIYTPTPPDEMLTLDTWCKQLVGHGSLPLAVEIGSYEGASAALLACYFDVVICFDPWGDHETKPGDRIASFSGGRGRNGHFALFMENMERLEIADRVIPVVGTCDFFKHFVPNPLPSLIFVDGSHTYEMVKKDLEESWIILGENGLVVVHDYRRKEHDGPGDPYIGVRQAVDESVERGIFSIHDRYSGIVALRKQHESISGA